MGNRTAREGGIDALGQMETGRISAGIRESEAPPLTLATATADFDYTSLHGGFLTHLSFGHPLAQVARQHCLRLHGSHHERIGSTACGACWERAIRDDERFAVLFGLPRELDTDPAYVDVIAVERACAGERLRLTPAERRAAVMVLVGRGYTANRIASRLRMTAASTRALLAELLAELDGDRDVVGQVDDVAEVAGRAA